MGDEALRELQSARGATFQGAAGAGWPAHYGDPAAEVKAARTAAVLADRSERGRLRLAGPDRASFLHGQSSNDVLALRPGQGHHTTFLTGKGKMRGDGRVYAFADHLLVGSEPEATAGVRAHLEAFLILDEVRIEDLGAETVELGVHGPAARAALVAVLGVEIAADLPEHHFVSLRFGGGELTIARERATGEDGFALFAPLEHGPALFERLADKLAPCGQEALEILRVEAGIPRYGRDMDEGTIPIEAGLVGSLSYDKGCYTGYEVLARIRTYGHVNRHLAGLLLSAPAGAGEAVLDGERPVGTVTSAVHSPTLGRPIALAMLRREVALAGRTLLVKGPAGPVAAEIATLPFVRRMP